MHFYQFIRYYSFFISFRYSVRDVPRWAMGARALLGRRFQRRRRAARVERAQRRGGRGDAEEAVKEEEGVKAVSPDFCCSMMPSRVGLCKPFPFNSSSSSKERNNNKYPLE